MQSELNCGLQQDLRKAAVVWLDLIGDVTEGLNIIAQTGAISGSDGHPKLEAGSQRQQRVPVLSERRFRFGLPVEEPLPSPSPRPGRLPARGCARHEACQAAARKTPARPASVQKRRALVVNACHRVVRVNTTDHGNDHGHTVHTRQSSLLHPSKRPSR